VRLMDSPSVRTWNEQVRQLADTLASVPENTYGFSCECGCGETVGLTAYQYDQAGGAWAEGHETAQPVQ
jgi:hypothetical protein